MGRILATLFVWLGFVIMTVTMLTSSTGAINNADGVVVFGIVLVLAIAASISTIGVWVGGRSLGRADSYAVGKSKRRRPRVEALVDALEDDEIYDLEALLLAREEGKKLRTDA